MTENIVTGKKYRILTDAANDIWDRISFWAKASDVQYDDNTTAEANKAVAILKRNASYTIGTVAYEPSAPSWVLLRCTQAGTTAVVIPSTYSTISSVGTVITDGTARFTVYDVRPSGTLSNSEYQVPAMSLVNGLDAELTANGNKFYFDYQNDTYGYNTSASRAAATFVPFGGSTLEFTSTNLNAVKYNSFNWTRTFDNDVYLSGLGCADRAGSAVDNSTTCTIQNTATGEYICSSIHPPFLLFVPQGTYRISGSTNSNSMFYILKHVVI